MHGCSRSEPRGNGLAVSGDMAGKEIDPFVIALAEAFSEVEEQYGISDAAFEQALLETLVSSPRFSWLSGNIWNNFDVTVQS